MHVYYRLGQLNAYTHFLVVRKVEHGGGGAHFYGRPPGMRQDLEKLTKKNSKKLLIFKVQGDI